MLIFKVKSLRNNHSFITVVSGYEAQGSAPASWHTQNLTVLVMADIRKYADHVGSDMRLRLRLYETLAFTGFRQTFRSANPNVLST